MIDYASEVLRDNAHWFGLLTFFIGLIVGNWLAVSRDRRKEFNEAARPIRTALLQQLDGLPRKSYRPDAVSNDEFIAFSIFIRSLSNKKYLKAVKTYQECFEWHKFPDLDGNPHKVVRNGDFAALETAITKLLKYCELR